MIKELSLPGVFYREPQAIYPDSRGKFYESHNQDELEEALDQPWLSIQSNVAISKEGVFRGIHFAPWAKKVEVLTGMAIAVIVDGREKSPTFGEHDAVVLNADNGGALYVPAGCGNSYQVIEGPVLYRYDVTASFGPCIKKGYVERAVRWNDSDLGLDKWLNVDESLLSDKDRDPSVALSWREFNERGYPRELWMQSLELEREGHERLKRMYEQSTALRLRCAVG